MKIENLAIAALVPYARNSRTHSDEQIAQIAASIREFGFTNPVLIDADGGIIAGHGRVMAARQLGVDRVPCIRLAHLTEAQRRAYVIADNKLALGSDWDMDTLFDELSEIDLDSGVLDSIGISDTSFADLLGDYTGNDEASVLDNHASGVKGEQDEVVDEPPKDNRSHYPVLIYLDRPSWKRWREYLGRFEDKDATQAMRTLLQLATGENE